MTSKPTRPPVEPLERRQLFAAVAYANHTITVIATPNVSNTITVGFTPDGGSIGATVAWVTGGKAHPKVHTVTDAYPVSDTITLVQITGSNHADRITIDQTTEPFVTATMIHAGGGNDTVTCGDEPDFVYGEGGNDLINGGGGNDTLYGQAGNDTLIGGAGDDFLSGRRGRDSLEGDAGNDTLLDPFGPDTILGGAGDNTLEVHSLATDKVNDYDLTKDTLQIVAEPDRTTDSGSTSFLGSLFPITSIL